MRPRRVLEGAPPTPLGNAGARGGDSGDGARPGGFAGFAPVPPSVSSASSALWRRWAELQRASDAAAETQVGFRPRASEALPAASTEGSRERAAARVATARAAARARPGLSAAARRVVLLGAAALGVAGLAAWRSSSSASPAPAPLAPSAPSAPSALQTAAEPAGLGAPRPAPRPEVDPEREAPTAELPDPAQLERLAVDALATGDRASAAAHYRELARRAPGHPGFAAAARILARPSAAAR